MDSGLAAARRLGMTRNGSALSRGLDHIVHAVRDLDATAELYVRLGFTVGARNRHAFGTHNRIVQFPGVFIELVTVAEPEKIRPAQPRMPSFGAFTRDFLAHGEGLSMLVLESGDAESDALAFRASGIGDFEMFRFERGAQTPDGQPVKVAFSLAFAEDPQSPQAGFFACQQHFPENFWNPAFQAHASGATGIAGVVLVAENPARHRNFLSGFAGVSVSDRGSEAIMLHTPRGDIEVMNPAEFHLQFGVEPPPMTRGLRLAAIRMRVRQARAVRARLDGSGFAFIERAGRVVVGPASVHGATIVFEADKAAADC